MVRGISGYFAAQFGSLRHPPGLVGRPGDLVGARLGALTLELACRVTPHGFAVVSVRKMGHGLHTSNGPTYEKSLRATWARWSVVRWLAPSLFLYYQTKRNRIVVVGRLPMMLGALCRTGHRPGWVAAPTAQSVSKMPDC